MDPAIFGAAGIFKPPDEDPDTFNSLREPYSFPRTEFRLTRDPVSGAVLGISASGDYLPPLREKDALSSDFPLTDSEIVKGSTENLRVDLASHFQRTPTHRYGSENLASA